MVPHCLNIMDGFLVRGLCRRKGNSWQLSEAIAEPDEPAIPDKVEEAHPGESLEVTHPVVPFLTLFLGRVPLLK